MNMTPREILRDRVSGAIERGEGEAIVEVERAAFFRKIGRNRGKARLWIEGKGVTDLGLAHGDGFILIHHMMGFDIAKVDEAPGSVVDGYKVRKVSGTASRPIIDLAGKTLDSLLLFGEYPKRVAIVPVRAGFGYVRREADYQGASQVGDA